MIINLLKIIFPKLSGEIVSKCGLIISIILISNIHILAQSKFDKISQYKNEIEEIERTKTNLRAQLYFLDKKIDSLNSEINIIINDDKFSNSKVAIPLSGANFYKNMRVYSSKIRELSSSDTLLVLDTLPNDIYIKVEVDGIVGYVAKSFLKEFEFGVIVNYSQLEYLKYLERMRIAEDEERKREIEKEKEEKLQQAYLKRLNKFTKKYGKEVGKKVADKKIWIGMTKDMCIDSWSEPRDRNRSVGTWGVHEQWIYYNTYLYFEDGVLTSWQD